jgi:arylsulfatase
VLVIVLDDTGFSHLGCYGSDIDTPNLDRLAAEGLRYTNFHTTALCSPSRACLLTGRDHHAVGMRGLSNWSSGFPNCTGRIDRSAATLAEVLRDVGYSTLAVGKWHLAPMEETSPAGPFDEWPLGRGFDRYYGFLQGETSQFHPELYCDNHPVDPPRTPEEGYHLSEDLVDQAIAMIHDQRSCAPERPFLCYLCFGATHAPHHAPTAYREKYRGRYDAGWDVVRQQWYERQLAMGIVPPGTDLAPRNPGVRPWDELSTDQQRLACRLQEAFAAFLDHTDAQIGRLLDDLRDLGVLDDTIVLALSDNGASQEGGPIGMLDTMRYFNGVPEDLSACIARLDEIGGPTTNNNYPLGWAQVGNTPLKRYKQNTYGGGVRDPLIVRWPRAIDDPGSIRRQFCHVSDLAPTVLEVVGAAAPAVHRGVAQQPVTGVSIAYTFPAAAADAPTRKHTQLFEMFGHRGLWHDGWKAVAYHEHGTDFDADQWELYHLDSDFSECHDRSAEHPGLLREMIERWWTEAGRSGALPLDDRSGELFGAASRRRLAQLGRRFVYYPPVRHVNADAAPPLGARSFTIHASVEPGARGADGVLLAYGATTSGFVLFVLDGRLTFDYNLYGDHTQVVADRTLPDRPAELGVSLVRHGATATATLLVDGEPAGSAEIPGVLRLISAQGMDIGRDPGSPVCDAYPAPFAFEGTLRRIVFELPEGPTRAEAEAVAAQARADLARQ